MSRSQADERGFGSFAAPATLLPIASVAPPSLGQASREHPKRPSDGRLESFVQAQGDTRVMAGMAKSPSSMWEREPQCN